MRCSRYNRRFHYGQEISRGNASLTSTTTHQPFYTFELAADAGARFPLPASLDFAEKTGRQFPFSYSEPAILSCTAQPLGCVMLLAWLCGRRLRLLMLLRNS